MKYSNMLEGESPIARVRMGAAGQSLLSPPSLHLFLLYPGHPRDTHAVPLSGDVPFECSLISQALVLK